MGAGRAGAECPVHPARRRVSGAEVRLRREDGQLGIAGLQCSQRDAGVAAEQLEHHAPALPVETGPHLVQSAALRCACGGVAQLDVHRVQGDRHAGQAEVQRAALLIMGRSGDGRSAAHSGVSVAVVTRGLTPRVLPRPRPGPRPCWMRCGSGWSGSASGCIPGRPDRVLQCVLNAKEGLM
jgi:hypothetical protein